MLLGRQTFEDFRGYWPEQTDDATGNTDYLNDVQKYVVSSSMTDPKWQNSTIVAGDPIKEVQALKDQPGQDIVVTGSITLCHTLIEGGLVDEYRLFVYPVVQGRGRRLFPEGFENPPTHTSRREGLPQRHHVLALRPGMSPSPRHRKNRWPLISRVFLVLAYPAGLRYRLSTSASARRRWAMSFRPIRSYSVAAAERSCTSVSTIARTSRSLRSRRSTSAAPWPTTDPAMCSFATVRTAV